MEGGLPASPPAGEEGALLPQALGWVGGGWTWGGQSQELKPGASHVPGTKPQAYGATGLRGLSP